MIVLHVITAISHASGGPSRSVQGLVAGLNRAGVEAWLATLRRGEEPWVDGVEHFTNGEPFENVVVQIKPQIVHLHGLWSLGLHRCAVICRRWNIPYVIAPRGMLEAWSLRQKWLKKWMARWMYQDWDLNRAAALHATAESEAEQFRRLGFKTPVIISPNGVNVPKEWGTYPPSEASPRSGCPSRGGNGERGTNERIRRVLSVSRMHPKKGVLELVEAWGKLFSVQSSRCNSINANSEHQTLNSKLGSWVCELVYTVSGDFEKEYEAKVKARVKELGLEGQFIFTGALNDDEKWEAYAQADLFVSPTYSENFGIVVAEALWAGVPVITTKGTPWSELESEKCGKWIDLPPEGSNPSNWPALVSALECMMSMADCERRQLGDNGRRLVEEKYTWDAVVKKMVSGYENILRGRF